MRNTNNTIVDFYHGAYGLTVRIDVQDLTWLKLFKESIIKLKNNTISELDILGIKGIEKREISGLKLILGTDPSLALVSTAQSGRFASFLWTVTKDNTIFIIGAIDRLMKSNSPGHYYFYEDDKFLIEFAYKE